MPPKKEDPSACGPMSAGISKGLAAGEQLCHLYCSSMRVDSVKEKEAPFIRGKRERPGLFNSLSEPEKSRATITISESCLNDF